MNLKRLGLLLLLLSLELFTAIVVYFSRFFLFIDDNKDFHQDQSDKLMKTTKLTY